MNHPTTPTAPPSAHSRRPASLLLGLGAGAGLTALSFLMMGQAAQPSSQPASQPVKSEPQYFVTADGEGAHLWVREGIALRVVAHGECKECAAKGHGDHAHSEGDGHDHAPTPKK